jgi:TonB-linked SusC/RagA family outer membrane protein
MTIKRLLRQFTLLLLCVILTQLAFSQTKTISGKVSDDKGNPIQGATVTVKGSKTGTSTDASGAFKLNVSATAKSLVISSVGFTQQEIGIGVKESFDVSLVPSSQSLTDVVVIGYSTAQRKDVTGSVASVKAKDFDKGATAPEELLIGKVAGLQIANNSGQPGGTTITKIRGNNSIVSGNNPLYVIDGVPIDASSPLPINRITGIGTSPSNNPLLFINPGDIAQIDVLKDASSAAIYGARGENGVVLITTNKGNGKMNIDAGVTLGTYAGLMKKADILSASQYRSELTKYGFKSDSGLSLDPFKDILHNKLSTVYSVALSGGGENGKFRASFSASDKEGIILKSALQQYNASFSGEHYFLNKKLKINFIFIGSNYTLQSAPISNDAGSTGNLISAAMNWNPTLTLVENGGYNQSNPAGQINPLALSAYTDDYSNVTQLMGIGGVSYKILPDLTYNFLYGISSAVATRNAQIQGYIAATGSNYDGKGAGQNSYANLSTQTITHTLTYEKKLKSGLNFRILAGYEFYQTSNVSSKYTTVWGFNFNAPGKPSYPDVKYYNDMGAGNQANLATGNVSPPISQLQSYFARGEVHYNDKYHFTATIRDDGSTKFGSENRYGVFPSFGLGWDILNENFMKKATFLNTLSLRLGYGQVGGQDGLIPGASQQLAIPTSGGGLSVQHYASPNLKWETLTSTNGGVDFGFLNNRVYGYFDYFSKKTTNPLFPGTLSVPSQGATIWQNLPGYITNKGFEFSLGIALVRSRDFTWNLSGNVEYVKNKFVYPALGSSPLFLTGGVNGQGVSSAFAQALANNQPIDVFYLRVFQGFDQNGIAKVASQASSYVGDPNPHVILGLNTDLTYKKLSLSINTHGQFGNKIFNNTLVSVTNLGNIANGKNISKTLIGTQESLANPVSASSRFLQSGNFVKLGNATISYNLGSFGNVIKSSRIFITGSNLFEITKYTGFDAEVNQDHNNNGVPSLGMDYIGYPTARSVTFGLTFSLY